MVCEVAIGLVIAGMVVVYALRLFVGLPLILPKMTWLEYVRREVERAGRVPLPLLSAGMLAMIGGLVFLAINGC